MRKICVIGEDLRTLNLKKMYINDKVSFSDLYVADYIIAPIPFTRDGIYINGVDIEIDDIILILKNTKKVLYTGAISQDIKIKLDENKIKYYDLLDFEEIAILNAIPTAEGAILKAMEVTNITIHDSNVLVMGYGKIGKVLSKMLQGLGANVYCEARNKKDIALIKTLGYNIVILDELNSYLAKFDIIFNTIPCVILDKSRLELIDKKCCIIDLASKPYGVDFEYAKK